jgi:DHA1 family inner membrane transport protein
MASSPPRLPWILLSAACWATFLVAASGMIRAPFLLAMARDLDASLTATANLFSLTAFAWGIAALGAGAASDRLGRLPLLLLAHALMIVGNAGIALSQSYAAAAVWALVAGAGGGGHMGVIFAAVSDRVAEAGRGRALGWVISGQSLAFVIGVPLATWLGSVTDWRGVMLSLAGADLAAMLGLWWTLRGGRSGAAPGGARPRLALPDRPILALLAAGITERVCFGVVAVYFATLLQLRYGLGMAALTLPLLLMAAGNLVGNALGGWIADRLPDRARSFALSSVGTSALALALFVWDPGLAGCVALGFAYAFVNALGRPAIMAELSLAPAEIRGALLGFNITCASIGWITAAAAGGLLIEALGIAALGWPTAVFGLVGAWLAFVARRLARTAPPA